MKELINFCPIHGYDKEIKAYPGGIEGYFKDSCFDGMELYVYSAEAPDAEYKNRTVGVHLKYWPYWLGFWRNDTAELAVNHKNSAARREYFGGASGKEEWLEVIRKNIGAALTAEPEYLVWHVSHAGLAEIFSYEFKYTDQDVVNATAEVIEEVKDCIPRHVKLLFENLWWPGLRLTDPALAEKFFRRVDMPNAGIMLDTGHLMNTEINLSSEQEGVAYILRRLDALGDLRSLIKGIHLNCSLSGKYRAASAGRLPDNVDFKEIMEHIVRIDQHRNFSACGLSELIACAAPEYIVHELYYDDLRELLRRAKQQSVLLKK